MSSSDDEGDALPHSVVEYYFEDKNNEPVSFSVLPIQWSEGEGLEGEKEQVFLRGTGDNGLKIYKQAIAWKFDLSNVNPEISVLLKDKSWIKLQKPRKIFEKIIKSILVTVHCLHYLQKNPETSEKSLWDRLSKVFRSFEDGPCENDLVDNLSLISEAVKRDDTLAKSKFLSKILKEKPRRRELPDKDIQAKAMSRFIVDDTDDMIDDADEDELDDDDDDDELFDSVCAFCDDGGKLLGCDGRCMRSFHPTEEDGCDSLGLTKDEFEAIQKFFCNNCKYRQHQCFACGKLGSSDKSLGAAEVFQCVNATCGQFYHPSCVAKILHRDNRVSAEELEKKISQGESFTCPIHKCCVCNQGENKKDSELQFAVCRRCPTSYHRKCLPRDITFEGMEVDGLETRAWESLLPNRILIYCLKHEIEEEIGTPIRDHIKFPDVGEKKSTFRKKVAVEEKTRKRISESLGGGKKSEPKTRSLFLEEPRTSSEKSKLTKKSSSFGEIGGETGSGNLSIPMKEKVNDASKKEFKSPVTGKKKSSLGDELYDHVLRSEKQKLGEYATPDDENDDENKTTTVKPAVKNLSSELPPLDPDSERRILNLIKEAESSINIEDIREKQQCESTDSHSLKTTVGNITLGKVEGAIEAVRTALQKLDEGCSMEDATAVCEPAIISQIFKWKSKFKIYLAPFLHGMRYTSFGRHFTKPEKLKEIVDKLHWYVQAGDMIVDFCCGSNDFSIFMKEKLEEMGKKCLYKNYDHIQTKNDFNFEMRDWMSIKPDELPTGSKLIMGLNPPFGIKANKFIDKALEFRPKLLILIVPQETHRLDEKKTPYALVWEDGRMLSGKSFYLPGSIDAKDKQLEDWNVRPLPLYLWSRPDWFVEHKAIAEKRGHLNSQQQEPTDETNSSLSISNHLTGHNQYVDDKSTPIDGVEQTNNSGLADGGVKSEGYKEISPLVNEVVGTKGQKDNSPPIIGGRGSLSTRNPRNESGGRGSLSTRNPRNESRNARRKRRRESHINKSDDRSPIRDRHGNKYRRSDSGTPSLRMQYRSPYSGNRAGNSDDKSRMYMANAAAPELSFRNLGHENLRAEPSIVPYSYGQPDLQIPVYDPTQSLPQFQAPYWYKEISPLGNEVVGTKGQKDSSPPITIGRGSLSTRNPRNESGGRGNLSTRNPRNEFGDRGSLSTRNPRNESRNARRKKRRDSRRNKSDDRSPVRDRHENRYRHSDLGTPSLRMQYRSPPHSGNRAGNSDDRSRMYMANAAAPELGNSDDRSIMYMANTVAPELGNYADRSRMYMANAPELSFRNLGHENLRAEPNIVPHSYGKPDLQIPVYDPAQSLPQFQAPYWPADSAVDPYMINTAPMQRHMPQLTGNLAFDPRAAGHHGYQGSLMNFALGPHHAYPCNSPGWLDD